MQSSRKCEEDVFFRFIFFLLVVLLFGVCGRNCSCFFGVFIYNFNFADFFWFYVLEMYYFLLLGYLKVLMGYLKVLMGYLKVLMSYFKVLMGYFKVLMGYLKVLIILKVLIYRLQSLFCSLVVFIYLRTSRSYKV